MRLGNSCPTYYQHKMRSDFRIRQWKKETEENKELLIVASSTRSAASSILSWRFIGTKKKLN